MVTVPEQHGFSALLPARCRVILALACGAWAAACSSTRIDDLPDHERAHPDDWFAPGHVIPLGDAIAAVDAELADLDGDGDLDLFVLARSRRPGSGVAPRLLAFLNDGRGEFSPSSLPPVTDEGWEPSGFDTTDMDADGDADILAWGMADGVWERRLYRNESGRRAIGVTLPDLVRFPRSGAPSGWVSCLTQPAFVTEGASPGTVEFYSAADAGGPARLEAAYVTTAEVSAQLTEVDDSDWFDYDGDYRLDVVSSPLVIWASTLRILTVNAGGGLTSVTSTVVPPGVRRFENSDNAWADFDGDGRMDLVVASYGSPFDPEPEVFLRNVGEGRLDWVRDAISPEPERRQVLECHVADFDLDGDPDVLFVGTVSSWSYLAENLGGFRFRAHELGWLSGAVALGDVDGDGDVDGYCGSHSHIMLNESDRAGRLAPR